MDPIIYENSSKDLTLENAIAAHDVGIEIAVNDGKDLEISIEKELEAVQS